jgi:integrase
LLREYEKLNDEKKPLVLESERLAAEAKKAEAEKANVMTIAKFAPLYHDLPEIKAKRSADRDRQLLGHVIRIMGNKLLAEIRRSDLFAYIEKRRKETLFRCGEWTKIPVKDGCIRNELAVLRWMLNLARRYKDDFAKDKDINYEVATVSFDVMPEANTRSRILKDTERQRLLEESPVWLQRLFIVALETCLSRGDCLRLEWDDIDEENGVIVPNGGRLKTEVRQAAPLTDAVKKVLADIKRERQRAKVQTISSLVFIREDGRPITGDMLNKARLKACKRAKVSDFKFHDSRHTAKTSWARRGIPVEAAMLGAGHASVQMHQAYVHLQASDIGKAFGTAPKIEGKTNRA